MGTCYLWYTIGEVIDDARELVERGWTVSAVRPNAVHLTRDTYDTVSVRVMTEEDQEGAILGRAPLGTLRGSGPAPAGYYTCVNTQCEARRDPSTGRFSKRGHFHPFGKMVES